MIRLLLHDVRAAGRGLRRRPLVPVIVAAVIAVGVSFLVTAFSVFDALLWRDTPYGPHASFVLLGETDGGFPPTPRLRADTYAAYQDAHDAGRLPSLEGLVPLDERDVSIVADGASSREWATWLLPDAYALLRARPIRGRVPADPDGRARLAREIAIGEGLWTRRFGRRDDVLGTRVTLDGEAAVIVGVMPAGFNFHRFSDVWVGWSRAEIEADPTNEVVVVGRIADGASVDQVLEATSPLRLAVRDARVPRDSTSRAQFARGLFGREYVPRMLANTILAMMALVLVAACLNVATLYMARLRLRAPDHATRLALGAGPRGVLRLLLAEVALVVAAGGVVAALVATSATTFIQRRMSGIFLAWIDVRLEQRGYAVTLAVLAAALAIVAIPAWRMMRRLDLARLLTHGGVLGGAPRHGRGMAALIAMQVAVVVVLGAAAFPVAVSAARLSKVSTGIDDDRVVDVVATASGVSYADEEARDRYAQRVRDLLLADPRVEGVSRMGFPGAWRVEPGVSSDTIYTDVGPDPIPFLRMWPVGQNVVSDDYLAVVGLRMIAGRNFDASVQAGSEPVAVLAAEAARILFPDQNALGRRFRHGAEGKWVRVIGVAENANRVWENWNGTTAGPDPAIYLSERQRTARDMRFHVRVRDVTPAVTPELMRDLEATVAGVDATQPVQRVRLLADEHAFPVKVRKWIAFILGGGAAVTVLLAMTGVVGLVSYYTTTRLPELALRITLGASVRAAAWLVAKRVLRSIAVGAVLGALLLTLVQNGIRRFLYETSTLDPVVLSLILGATLAVAAAALAVPLRRLRTLEPQALLRAE